MNKRIQELALEAGGNPNYKAFRGYFLPPPPNYIDPATVDLGKFAELIIRETLKVTGATPSMTETAKKHFGVEEK